MNEVFDSIENALEYVKGYCNKHKTCEGRDGNCCRLYDPTTKLCLFYNSPVPCDWEIERG